MRMHNPGIDRSRISPEFLQQLVTPIEDVYDAIQRDLVVNIAKKLNIGAALQGDAPFSVSWMSYMLQQIGGLSREHIAIISSYSGSVSKAVQKAVRTAVARSIEAVEPDLVKAVEDPGYVPAVSETTQRIMDAYEAQAIDRCNLVNTVMLESSVREYETMVRDVERRYAAAQKVLNAETGSVVTGAKAANRALRDAVTRMADHGIPGFVDRRGREWTPQAYIEMDMRTTAANVAREAAMRRNEDYGNHLIFVSSHPGARPLCEPWQGHVLSTDGTSGTAKDANGVQHDFIPLESTSYGQPAGLFGINCGHMSFPFVAGRTTINWPEYDHEETVRLYRESQEQRYMEREIRGHRLKADALAAAGDADGAKEYRRRARVATAELRDWCVDHQRDFYPERTRIVRPAGR